MNTFSAWFLVLFLGTADPDVTYTVSISQPDEATCLQQLNKFIYVESIEGDEITRQVLLDKVCRKGET